MTTTCVPVCTHRCTTYTIVVPDGKTCRARPSGAERIPTEIQNAQVSAHNDGWGVRKRFRFPACNHPCRPMFASVPAAVTRDGVTRLVADCYADLRTAMAANAVARDVQR